MAAARLVRVNGISNFDKRKTMKTRKIFAAALTVLILAMSLSVRAQENEEIQYRRSSIYTLLINHTEQDFGPVIRQAFLDLPVPDKYNNHNLSIRIVDMQEKLQDAKKDRENQAITDFLTENQIASRLVAKWFDRDFETGACDMELIKERGLYNATEIDKAVAMKSTRGKAMLEDAGEDLIGNTFVLVNDIRYVDKSEKSAVWGAIVNVVGAGLSIAGTLAGNSNLSSTGDLVSTAGDMVETLKGFKVRINTFLYQLVWNDEVAGTFYSKWQAAGGPCDPFVFNNMRDKFTLKYVGKVESKGSTTSFMGVNLDQPINMVRKACQRALDENVVTLQREFEAFRTKSPLISDRPLRAYVGMKEGVTSDSRFEVLEAVEDKNGKIRYEKVGEIKPKSDLIWDNRYMAVEERAENATLGFTTFEKVKGGSFKKGMLIREIKH